MTTRITESRYLVKLAWVQVGIGWLVALVATWFRGLKSEVIIGWIALIALSVVMILAAYEVRRTILAAITFFVAILLFASSLLWNPGWEVRPDELQDMAFGGASLSLWFVAWDVRTDKAKPIVGLMSAVIVLLSFVVLLALRLINGPAFFGQPKIIIAISAIAALYDMAKKEWKIPLALGAMGLVTIISIDFMDTQSTSPQVDWIQSLGPMVMNAVMVVFSRDNWPMPTAALVWLLYCLRSRPGWNQTAMGLAFILLVVWILRSLWMTIGVF